MARETGSVKWFSNEKGYGFIERESGEDVFVHHSDIEGEGFKTLRQGEQVEFELISAEKGPKALNVVREEHLQDGGSEAGEGPAATGAREDEAVRGETEREAAAGDRSLGSQLREKLGKRFFNEEG